MTSSPERSARTSVSLGLPANNSLQRTRVKFEARFARQRSRRAAELMIRWAAHSRPAYTQQVKVRELIRTLEDDGWVLVRTRGSHRQYRHPSKPGTVTVSGKARVDVPVGTLRSALKQAGLLGPKE